MIERDYMPRCPGGTLRKTCSLCLALLLLGLLIAAGSVPYVAGSSSLLYKFGWDKTLLQWGKVCGLAAAVLLMAQLVLSARLKTLDRILSLPVMMLLHRWIGFSLAGLALLHSLLIYASEGVGLGPLDMSLWPEMVGAALLLSLCMTVTVANWRKLVAMPYGFWRWGHGTTGALAIALLGLHVLNVSSSFEGGWPRWSAWLLLVLCAALLAWRRIVVPLAARGNRHEVLRVKQAGKDAFDVALVPQKGKVVAHLPGQFAFLTFRGTTLSSEPHPFTIASSPADTAMLRFTIRCSGDWTSRIGAVESGTAVDVEGPYGLFSHLALAADGQELVMVAGGVGITPFLSMLRYMENISDGRKVTLVWSNRTREDAVLTEELESIRDLLPGLTVHHHYTREEGAAAKNRLDAHLLGLYLKGCDTKGRVLLCGPPLMMDKVRVDLKSLGFAGSRIHFERFALV